ncbi:MAG TPA: YtxH domain-containing protein [Candidatus Saccharimonadales bacterium]|jgi:gas vesicle protein|nr:YtxH domain-containing protein [Candidatus Saccharimonadales bacterium]
MSKSNTKKWALGTIFAAVGGFVAGILTAPKSGKETRQDIKNAAETSVAEAEKELKKLHTQLNELLTEAHSKFEVVGGKTKEQFEAALAGAKKTKEKVRVLLSAVHEGDAEDRDLKKAIDEASKAVNHLKTYLKKPN